MKKMTLAFATLLSLGLAGCAQQAQEGTYKGQILFSAYEGNNLKLTIRNNNCDHSTEGNVETFSVTQVYDSDLPVGACVRVTQSENGPILDNISRTKSRSWIARSGQ
ncbi:MAG: hypothetical protein Q4B95_05785 [Lonepinella koalarum]|nr:hypothetical protein [Lonepinella koalarum]